MPDFLTTDKRSDLMRRIRSTGTGPERLLLAALRSLGAEPQSHAPDLPGKPDIVFRRQRLACFVDGEKWHGGQWRRRGASFLDEQYPDPAKRAYWVSKINRNIQRDIRVTAELLASGWSVLRFWDRAVEADPHSCAGRILRAREQQRVPSHVSVAATATAADFFSGIGLMRLGLKAAGWRTVWANDCDPTKCRLYLHNLGDDRVELDNRPIQRVGVGRIPQVALAAACFPCADLSLAGKQMGLDAGPQSSSYLRFAEMLTQLRAKRPTFVLLENVLGLLTNRGGADFRRCLELLQGAGYLIDAIVVNAHHFVPQSRPRLFVLGVRNEIDLAPLITPTDLSQTDRSRPFRLAQFMRDNRDLRWAIRPMPALPPTQRTLVQLLEDIPAKATCWWDPARVERLMAQTSARHLDAVGAAVNKHGFVWATAFRRMRNGKSTAELRFDGIAGCLRTPKGGSAKQILIRADENGWRVRLLTPRECARLMGADGFRTDAEAISEHDALFGFGDAVAVPVVAWIVRNYFNPIAVELLHGCLLTPDASEI